MTRWIRTTFLLVSISLLVLANVAAQEPVPTTLRNVVTENFPLDLHCVQEGDRQNGITVPSAEQQMDLGCIRAYSADLCQGCKKVAVVVYATECPTKEMVSPGGRIRAFWRLEDGWALIPGVGVPTTALPEVDLDGVKFSDIDGDGELEIILYTIDTMSRLSSYTVSPWKVTEVGLKPMIPPDLGEARADLGSYYPLGEPSECRQDFVMDSGSQLTSTTPILFRDLDHDGKLELIQGPDQAILPDPNPDCTPEICGDYAQDVTGTRIYRLVDGVYQKVGETAVGRHLDPPVVVAMAPSAMPQEELLIAGERVQTGEHRRGTGAKVGEGGTVSLYVSVPAGYGADQVDWTTARVAFGELEPERDEGWHQPAPADQQPESWYPMGVAGQTLKLEDVKATHPDDFRCTDDDPVIFLGPGGRMHFTSRYRVLRFDREEVIGWLSAQWRDGKALHKNKTCLTKDGVDRCSTPIGLPFEVKLNVSAGAYPVVAHGTAMLWVRNRSAAAVGPRPALVDATKPDPSTP